MHIEFFLYQIEIRTTAPEIEDSNKTPEPWIKDLLPRSYLVDICDSTMTRINLTSLKM